MTYSKPGFDSEVSFFVFHVFDIIYDIAFLFVVTGKTNEEREPQRTRLNKSKTGVYIIAAILSGK